MTIIKLLSFLRLYRYSGCLPLLRLKHMIGVNQKLVSAMIQYVMLTFFNHLQHLKAYNQHALLPLIALQNLTHTSALYMYGIVANYIHSFNTIMQHYTLYNFIYFNFEIIYYICYIGHVGTNMYACINYIQKNLLHWSKHQ